MMMIVRLYPRYEVDKVWDFVDKKFSKIKGTGVLPLFMSEQDSQNYVSVILEVGDPDALITLFERDLAGCHEIADTRTVALVKPAFFPVPRSVSSGISRFLVPVKINPCNYTEVFEKVLKLEPPKGIHFAYVTLTLGEEDMIISLLGKDWDSVRSFVSEKIEKIPGVESIRIGLTHRTKRLVDLGTWKHHQEKYAWSRFIQGRPMKGDYSFDWTYQDQCAVHGALPDEA